MDKWKPAPLPTLEDAYLAGWEHALTHGPTATTDREYRVNRFRSWIRFRSMVRTRSND